MPLPTEEVEEEVYTQVVPSIVQASNAPGLFAQQLSQASKGHKYHGWTLWLTKRDNQAHYFLFDKNLESEGIEVIPSEMHAFAQAQSYFTRGENSRKYERRKKEWEAFPKSSED